MPPLNPTAYREVCEALTKAAKRFRDYEREHVAKAESAAEDAADAAGVTLIREAVRRNQEAGDKAERNREMAELCEDALRKAEQVSSSGERLSFAEIERALNELSGDWDETHEEAFAAGWKAGRALTPPEARETGQ